jgi:membrane protease YdiL (CAAX protease family)
MTVIDHLLFAVIAVAHPVGSYISWHRLMRRIAAGEVVSRPQLYNVTMASHWTLFGVTLALWLGASRSWSELGFSLDIGPWFYAGLLLSIVCFIGLAIQVRQVRAMPQDELNAAFGELDGLEVIIPRNGNELGRFYALSVTAGIVEETLWRGFMIWYLAHIMPAWMAGVVSAVAFGVAHIYQGAAKTPRIVVVGLVFAALYLTTGSLWLPMLVHAAVDIVQGRIGYEAMMSREDNEPPANPDLTEDPVA